jgi:predicted CopG family antitoxin
MATKTITIKEEAYERLKKLKDGKSFSDVIMDLTDDREVDLSEAFGAWSEEEAEEAREKIEKFRKDFDSDFDEKVES